VNLILHQEYRLVEGMKNLVLKPSEKDTEESKSVNTDKYISYIENQDKE